MNKVDDDKKHIVETMNRDKKLADEIKKLSNSSMKTLAFYLNDFANKNSSKGVLQAYILNKMPDNKDRDNIKALIDEVDTGKIDEVDAMITSAGSYYKKSNSLYLLAVITIIGAGLLNDTYELQKKYDIEEKNSEISYLFSNNGDFSKIADEKDVQNMYTDIQNVADDKNGSIFNSDYENSQQLISKIYTKVTNSIKTSPQKDDFTSLITSVALMSAVVSLADIKNTPKRVISDNINGLFDTFGAKSVAYYRTFSAKIDSEFKRSIAKRFKIKEAIIVNELGACKYCMQRIGRVYDYNTACDFVPQHPNCRCEVKLLVYGDEDYEDN